MKKILLNIDESILTQLDALAQSRGVTRSAFIRESLGQVVQHAHKLQLEESMRRGYEQMAEINLDWAQLGMGADAHTLSVYEDALVKGDQDDTKRGDL